MAHYSQGENVDEPLAMLRSAATSYYHADGLGSITSLSTSAGALANTYTYDSFGNVTSTGNVTNSFQYTAREQGDIHAYYYRARYYDPIVGRFLSQDPIGFRAGPNMYAYVHNNPGKYTDPIGLKKTCTPLGDPLRISPWFKWANGPPIPLKDWKFDVISLDGPDEGIGGVGFGGGDSFVCHWSRPVKQDISRYAYFLYEYRCVDDDPSKCGSTPGPWGDIPNNVSIEWRIEKRTRPATYEFYTQDSFKGPLLGIASADDILNEILCRTRTDGP